jgi:FdhD protein
MRIGFTTVVAVSAATALAIDLARQANINLLGFVRRGQHVVYHGLSNVEESDE